MTVTALDRANAEDALLPIPKVFDSHEKEKAFQNSLDKDVIDDFHRSSKDDSVEIEGIDMIFSWTNAWLINASIVTETGHILFGLLPYFLAKQ